MKHSYKKQFTANAIQDLASHPEYVEPPREELQAITDVESMAQNIDNLPLLDSFLKESARVSQFDAGT